MTSKKRSATKPPESITYFVDRSLGHQPGEALRSAGATVQFHDDHFPENALDVDWLPEVGARGWVVLTKDKRIRYRTLEREAILAAKLRVFVLASSKGLTGAQMGELFVKNRHRMDKLTRKQPPPFIAGLYANTVRLYDL